MAGNLVLDSIQTARWKRTSQGQLAESLQTMAAEQSRCIQAPEIMIQTQKAKLALLEARLR